jgi:hypothetical protein
MNGDIIMAKKRFSKSSVKKSSIESRSVEVSSLLAELPSETEMTSRSDTEILQVDSVSPSALQGWRYRRALSNSNSISATNYAVKVALNSSNFDFSSAKQDGSDLRVYDETASALLPMWLLGYDPVGQTVVLYYKATNTLNAHGLYYGNPAATAVMNFAAVFDHGTGFDADWGDMTVNLAANGRASRLARATGITDLRYRQVFCRSQTPNVAGTTNSGNVCTRNMTLMTDTYGNIVRDASGNYVGYYASYPSSPPYPRVYRCVSTDAVTWTNHTLIFDPTHFTGLGSSGLIPHSVFKMGPTDYRMFLSALTANIIRATSTDGLTWTLDSTAMLAAPAGITDYTVNSFSIAPIRQMSDGNYVIVIQSRPASPPYTIHTWSSPDLVHWTILNGGVSTMKANAAVPFMSASTTNAFLFQNTDGIYLLIFSGGVDIGNYSEQIGFASSNSYSAPFTVIDALSPVAGRLVGYWGAEISGVFIDSDGSWVIYAQIYDAAPGSPPYGSLYRLWPITQQGGLIVTPADTDGALAGVVLSPTASFKAEMYQTITAHRGSTSVIIIGICDSATVPSPTTSASFPSYNIQLRRCGADGAGSSTSIETPGAITFLYSNTGSVANYWNGSAWGTAAVSASGTDLKREIIASISDDGTNYVYNASYSDTGALIASAIIAKSSVKPFANGRCLIVGDAFTTSVTHGSFIRMVGVRAYAAVEPIIFVASRDSAALAYTLSGPAVGSVNSPAIFTVAPNGLYSGTIAINLSGGGLPTPIVLTFVSSTVPQSFTIIPISAGNVKIRATNDGGLPNPPVWNYSVRSSHRYQAMTSIKDSVTTQVVQQKNLDLIWHRDYGEVSDFSSK